MKLSTAYYNLFYLVILEGIRPFGVTQTGGGQRSTPRNEDGCPPMPDLPNIAPAAVPMSAAAGSSSTAASSNDAHLGGVAATSDNTDSPLAPTQLLLSDAFDESADSDAPEMDYAAEAYSFHERTLHFLPGQQINQSTRVQVEAALLIEAGTNVTSEHTTDLVMKTEYLKLLNGFQPTDFGDKDIKEMSCKLYNAKRGINEEGGGERLWKKFNDVRAEIRAKYMTKLPADLWKLASGKQLRDAYNKFIKDNYKVEKVSTTVKQLFCTIYIISYVLPTPFIYSFQHSNLRNQYSRVRMKRISMFLMIGGTRVH